MEVTGNRIGQLGSHSQRETARLSRNQRGTVPLSYLNGLNQRSLDRPSHPPPVLSGVEGRPGGEYSESNPGCAIVLPCRRPDGILRFVSNSIRSGPMMNFCFIKQGE